MPEAQFQEAEATEETTMTEQQDAALRTIAHSLHRLNHAVIEAVEAGLTVELIRTCRYHGNGKYGDQLTPVIKT